MEQVVERSRSQWRVTVINHIVGAHHTYDRHERDRYRAIAEALREFEALHPECDRYGYTHGLWRVEPVHQEEIEGGPA